MQRVPSKPQDLPDMSQSLEVDEKSGIAEKPGDDTIDKIAKEIEMKMDVNQSRNDLSKQSGKVNDTNERIKNLDEMLDQIDTSGFFGFLGLYEELKSLGKSLR